MTAEVSHGSKSTAILMRIMISMMIMITMIIMIIMIRMVSMMMLVIKGRGSVKYNPEKTMTTIIKCFITIFSLVLASLT